MKQLSSPLRTKQQRFFVHASWINQHVPCKPPPPPQPPRIGFFLQWRETQTHRPALPRPFPHECRNYKLGSLLYLSSYPHCPITQDLAGIPPFPSPQSEHTCGVSSAWLACETLVLTPVFWIPSFDTTQLKNFSTFTR